MKNPEFTSLELITAKNGFVFRWGIKDFGFGILQANIKNNKLIVDTEMLGEKFAGQLLKEAIKKGLIEII